MPETSQQSVISPRTTKLLAIGLLVGTLLWVAVDIVGPVDLPGWPPLAVTAACWSVLGIRASRSRSR